MWGYIRYINPSSAHDAHLLGIAIPSMDVFDASSAKRIVLSAKLTPLLPMTQELRYASGIPK